MEKFQSSTSPEMSMNPDSSSDRRRFAEERLVDAREELSARVRQVEGPDDSLRPILEEAVPEEGVTQAQDHTTSIAVSSQTNNAEKPWNLALALPEGVIRDKIGEFAAAFPSFADQFRGQQIKYWVGVNKVTRNDLEDFTFLLTQPETLMGEAYVFYEILTQQLSEKAAKSKGGIVGFLQGFMASAAGWMGYKLDLPVLIEWRNLQKSLEIKIGKNEAEKLIENMYFGGHDGYLDFLKACETNDIDFAKSLERANKRSYFLAPQHREIKKNPKSLQTAAGLNLPGKIYDSSSLPLVGVSGLCGVLYLATGSPIFLPLMAASVASIPVAEIGVMYHEMTHLLGGNYRNFLKNRG